MNILIACDKFKGSINAQTVCDSIAKGIKQNNKNAICNIQPLADGGDGSISIIKKELKLDVVVVETVDPLRRNIQSRYYHNDTTAFIELAETSGLSLLREDERNALATDCIGTGIIIQEAISKGFKDIVLSIGGSCTTEAGLSIASALGFQFLDKDKISISPNGANLVDIIKIIPPRIALDLNLTILCDVENPLHGPMGAAHIFAKQKGATTSDIIFLDQGLENIGRLLESYCGHSIASLSGGGAAGGIAAGLHALLDAEIVSGFEYISDIIQLEAKIKQADLVITGEGHLDSQSFGGKVIGQISKACKGLDVPLIAIVGQSSVPDHLLISKGITKAYQIMDIAQNQQDAMDNAAAYLIEITSNIDLKKI